MSQWVISYDIADDKRRRRIAKVLLDAGMVRIQESVFEGWLAYREIEALRQHLIEEMKPAEDSICAWPLSGARGPRRASAPPQSRSHYHPKTAPRATETPRHWILA